MEFLRFIFSGAWVFLGLLVLVTVVLDYLVKLVKAIRAGRKVKLYDFGDNKSFTVEIENAKQDDIEYVVRKYATKGVEEEND